MTLFFDKKEYEDLKQLYKPYFDIAEVAFPNFSQQYSPKYAEQIEGLLEAAPPIFSFIYGIPSPEVLKACRAQNIKTMGTATTPAEAVALLEAGVDAIVATGFEAGGHRVSFLKPAEDSLIGLFSLIPQVVDKVKIPEKWSIKQLVGHIADH